MELKTIARIKNDFPTKFGLPRQSGLSDFKSEIIFEKEYSVDEAFRGIDEFSHLIIIWGFSEAERENWSPTVRPPRLGGNKRVGVFATRSPFRPNSIGLTVVKLISVNKRDGRVVLTVSGADMMSGTPIYDVKPYLSFADSVPDAVSGFADGVKDHSLDVVIDEDLVNPLPSEPFEALIQILSQDPRPSYQDDPDRVYGFEYAGCEVKFTVNGKILYVKSITKKSEA
ncbi:MAG: tRNA (N6-threonylcarbamoyladenosine(37)-N6)-methyltransferase TrmO [Ruminococcaceae bacterium]|nr:tRNA (N6-threonylcarbamoyladenosine(37)-N6)-methyltransferase TrmO [Oscillospiraceae bacterium]